MDFSPWGSVFKILSHDSEERGKCVYVTVISETCGVPSKCRKGLFIDITLQIAYFIVNLLALFKL